MEEYAYNLHVARAGGNGGEAIAETATIQERETAGMNEVAQSISSGITSDNVA